MRGHANNIQCALRVQKCFLCTVKFLNNLRTNSSVEMNFGLILPLTAGNSLLSSTLGPVNCRLSK